MADYQLTANDVSVIRTADGAFIPNNEDNPSWLEYQQWLAAGGVPDPYETSPAPPPPTPTPEEQVLYDHENRIRTLEGQPPLTLDDFVKTVRGE